MNMLFEAGHVGKWFKTDYQESRTNFQRQFHALSDVSWFHRAWSLPNHKGLVTDAVWVGRPNAEKVVVLISGVHGVEGFCGSAVQSFMLQAIESKDLVLPRNTALLVIHALNPWGMHWNRRCDQNGVDLNRNFVDFKKLSGVNPEYADVEHCLNQQDGKACLNGLAELRQGWGQDKFDRIFSEGQYHLPWAPFYGGEQPAFANTTIDEIISHWHLSKREVLVLDIHSGLGPWGFGELISDHPALSGANKYARSHFGGAVAVTESGNSFSVPKNGLLDYRWHKIMKKNGCFLTLEFGTYGTDSLFGVLVDEHRYWRALNGKTPIDDQFQAISDRMLEHFCPQDALWQQAVLFKAWQIIERAIQHG